MIEGSGRICLFADPLVSGAQSFRPGAPLHLKYESVGTCLSSSCTRDRSAACSTAIAGVSIQVSSVAMWIDASGEQNDACTLDCVMLQADCATEPLPAGSYEVRFGAASTALVIPSEHTEAPCVDALP